MKHLAKFLIFVFALTQPVLAQSTAVITATHLVDDQGHPLVAGQFCFGAACVPVTNGVAASIPVVQGTAPVTITNASGTATYLIVSNVTIASSSFSWDSYTITSAQTASGLGTPTMACSTLARYRDLYSNQGSTCLGGNWIQDAQIRGSGEYAANGVPTFACVSPCKYTQNDASPQSAAIWAIIAPVNTPSLNWVQQGGTSGSSSSNIPQAGTPSGAINGTNTVFTLPSTPVVGSLLFTVNGLVSPGTLSGATETLTTAPQAGDTVYAYWSITGGTTTVTPFSEVPAGTINGTNTTFTLSHTPVSGSLQVQENGLFLSPAIPSYTLSGTTITFATAPQPGDSINANYDY